LTEDDPKRALNKIEKLTRYLGNIPFRQRIVAAAESIPTSIIDGAIFLGKIIAPPIYNYFKNKRLTFYKNLNDELTQIESLNTMTAKVFSTSLSNTQLNLFKTLRGYHEGYLENVFTTTQQEQQA
jgi:hypothetical protein